jgi:hypothetical protein
MTNGRGGGSELPVAAPVAVAAVPVGDDDWARHSSNRSGDAREPRTIATFPIRSIG